MINDPPIMGGGGGGQGNYSDCQGFTTQKKDPGAPQNPGAKLKFQEVCRVQGQGCRGSFRQIDRQIFWAVLNPWDYLDIQRRCLGMPGSVPVACMKENTGC